MAAELGPNKAALEIGPGIGALTQQLAKLAGRVLGRRDRSASAAHSGRDAGALSPCHCRSWGYLEDQPAGAVPAALRGHGWRQCCRQPALLHHDADHHEASRREASLGEYRRDDSKRSGRPHGGSPGHQRLRQPEHCRAVLLRAGARHDRASHRLRAAAERRFRRYPAACASKRRRSKWRTWTSSSLSSKHPSSSVAKPSTTTSRRGSLRKRTSLSWKLCCTAFRSSLRVAVKRSAWKSSHACHRLFVRTAANNPHQMPSLAIGYP